MPKTPALVFGVIGGYLVWRYYNISDTEITLTDDLGSTLSTIGAWAVPSNIPFDCRNPKTGEDYKPQIQYSARLTGVPPLLLAALIRQESKFNPTVVSGAGAMGLGQFMPDTAKEWFGDDWLSGVYNPERAIHQTARYLAWLYRQFGTWRMAVAAYNGGIGNLKTRGSIAAMKKETRDYVRVVYDTWANQLPA